MIAYPTHLLTVGLSMIVKDEEEVLENAFKSIQPCRRIFDEIVVGWTGTNPKTKAILDRYATKVFPVEWEHHIGKTRQKVHDVMKSDLVMWMDADDELLNPHQLEGGISQAMLNPRCGAYWLGYYYGFDEDGNCTTYMQRERVVRRPWFKWVGAMHENLLLDGRFAAVTLEERPDAAVFKHNTNAERMKESQKRCVEIASIQIKREQETGEVDPRTILDLGRALMSVGAYKESLEWFDQYLRVCGWDDMRYYALNLMADMFREFRQYDKAKECNHQASIMKPKWPEAYVGLAKTAFREHSWDDTLFFCEILKGCDTPAGIIPCDPTQWTTYPLKLIHLCLAQKGHFDKALYAVDRAIEAYPSDKTLESCRKSYVRGALHTRLEQSLVEVKQWLEEAGETEKLPALARAIPAAMEDYPSLARFKNEHVIPTLIAPNGKRIVMFCGDARERWDGKSLEIGIGGSEEAVIHMSRLLAKKGYLVDVYGTPNEEMEEAGVRWKHWYTYDAKRHPGDIFIAWRLPEYIEHAPPSGKTRVFLWCHDVQLPHWWDEARMNRVEKIFMLSKDHRATLPQAPEEKIFYTANGIPVEQFIETFPRDPYKCLYMSSPDRGLEYLLHAWGKIREAVPKAELVVAYGFTQNYDDLAKGDARKTAFKTKIMEQLQQPGIKYVGRISHAEIAHHCLTGQIWPYPCIFREISCISGMKAQAGGLIPAIMNTAALKETVQHGLRVNGDIRDPKTYRAWIDSVIGLLQNPEECEKMRGPMREWAQQKFAWETVADGWDELFKSAPAVKEAVCITA